MSQVISSSADIQSQPGFFAKIGDGAKIGRNSDLGNWSSIGHFAKVGNNVEFGPWASVGMCAIVSSGVKLGSHQHVRSGHKIWPSGEIAKLDGFSEEDRILFRLYDSIMGSGGPRSMSLEQGIWVREEKKRQAEQFLDLLPAFLERRQTFRRERLWFTKLLLPFSG